MSDESKPSTPAEIARLSVFLRILHAESDRGAALCAGSMIDEVLLQILRAFMLASRQTDDLLDGGAHAPLGSFSSRISACYALGLIDDAELADINAIRKIRNEFAHAWAGLSFTDAPVCDLVRSTQDVMPDRPDKTLRSRFDSLVACLLGELLWRERLVSKERRTSRVWPYKAGFRPR